MNLKLVFLGTGNAFCGKDLYQSNAVIEFPNGKLFLIDCGSDIRHSIKESYPEINNGNLHKKIDSIYISHIHADHVGGLEWPAFCTYFNPDAKRSIELAFHHSLYKDLWNETLKGSLKCVSGSDNNTLKDYFTVYQMMNRFHFQCQNEDVKFELVESRHVKSPKNKYSYGLFINNKENKTYYSTDVMFDNYNHNRKYYNDANLIFHDCETTPYKSGFHAHYDELKTLPEEIKSKMYLYHYSDDYKKYNPIKDGFLGFAEKSKKYDI